MILLPLLLLSFALVEGFPNYQDPFSAGPSITIPTTTSSLCRVPLFQNATLDSYSTVYKFPYFPANCLGHHWNRVVLQVKGWIQGVQYDRAGALWLQGVELLRMTTPEPTQNGIHWKVERDVTLYASLFAHQQGEAQLQIPNNVNKEYTGAIHLSAQLVFYKDEDAAAVPVADYVWSTTNPTQNKDAWASMAIRGNQSKTIRLPSWSPQTVARAHIDLYASAHGCEEFWYTNPPDSISKQTGMCGGGSTRQIQLLIDNKVVGSQPPFPVVYTGGINPLLWRPQTGIYSFNVPPYFFDITPFLGILNDGESHEISVRILGNNEKGEWNVDPVLVAFQRGHNNSQLLRQRPTLDRYEFIQRGPRRSITNASSFMGTVQNFSWVEEYESELIVEATLPGGEVAKLSSKSTSFITNSLIGDNLQITSVDMKGSMFSSAYDRQERFEYPLKVATDFQQSKTSFRIEASIEQGLKHSLQTTKNGDDNSILYQDNIVAAAIYNRSTDRTVHVAEGSSHQNASLVVGTTPCLTQTFAAQDGFVTYFDQAEHGTCILATFCSQLDSCSPRMVNASTTSKPESSSSSSLRLHSSTSILQPQADYAPSPGDMLAFRHPLLRPHWPFALAYPFAIY